MRVLELADSISTVISYCLLAVTWRSTKIWEILFLNVYIYYISLIYQKNHTYEWLVLDDTLKEPRLHWEMVSMAMCFIFIILFDVGKPSKLWVVQFHGQGT